MTDCLPYPDMMTDMRDMLGQVETVRAAESRGPTILVFTDVDGNWTMFALDETMQACVLATGSRWMMKANEPE